MKKREEIQSLKSEVGVLKSEKETIENKIYQLKNKISEIESELYIYDYYDTVKDFLAKAKKAEYEYIPRYSHQGDDE